MEIGDYFVPHGWVCPKCGRVYSPSTPMCSYCGNEEIKIAATTNPTEYITEWNKYLNHVTIGGSDFWDDIKKQWINQE